MTDWYHNAGVIVFACLSSWLVAVLGGGIAWIMLIMATCGTYYRTSVRRVRRNFRDDVNREMAKQRLDTDTESLEWINSFLVKFWPIFAPVLYDGVINSVDQVLSTVTPPMVDSMRLKTFTLGTKPPRLEYVKTYPKTDPDSIVMDWKFSFTPNDIMDLTARQLKDKINPKVVLEVRIGKGVLSKGLDVIVQDMACSGLIRVKIKLQIDFPHVERIDVCFLERPEIDYVCKPLGGDTLGFDVNFIPGLESFIKEQIHSNLAPMMYAPNVFPVEVAKILSGNAVDQAIGVVAVTIYGARNLKNPDAFAGTPDPYATVSINDRHELGRTKTILDTDSPTWNETLYVIITSFADSLTIAVYDWNEFRKDKKLGTATFAMDQLEENPDHENLFLEVLSSGRSRGGLRTDIRFFPVLEGRTLETGEIEPPPESNSGIARFTVEQAKELDSGKSMVGALNPYAVLLLNGKEIHTTKTLKRNNNPIFPDSSTEILITDRRRARLGVAIKDERDLMSHQVVGSYQIKLNDMLRMMDKGQEWFQLRGTKSGKAKLTLQWKPVALGGIAGGMGYVDPIGILRIHFKSASDLRNLETVGKSDPYARALLSGIVQGRTVTFRSNLNPEWDEVVYVPIHSSREKLSLEVMDEESTGSDRSLGAVEVSVADFVREGENGEYEIDDEKQLITSGLRLGRNAPKGHLNYTIAFYPAVPVVNPEEEEKEEAEEENEAPGDISSVAASRKRSDSTKTSLSTKTSHSRKSSSGRISNGTTPNSTQTKGTPDAEPTPRTSEARSEERPKAVPKILINTENLTEYESGFIVFKIHDVKLLHSNVYIQILMDDYMFPSYISAKIPSKTAKFSDVGDAFVRELEWSKMTVRLVDKIDAKDDADDHTLAKLTGETLRTLYKCLYNPMPLVLRSKEGENVITVSARYIPVTMKLDPTESVHNMGTLRVKVLDAADLPSADRNGFSDPFCKFVLGDKEVFKTKVQKKTLHPVWNEEFVTEIKSRIGANFRVDVYDWDFGERADFLGSSPIDLETLDPGQSKDVTLRLDGKSGTLTLRLLFNSSYVQRSRQGTSAFHGTFAAPVKIVGAPVKGVGLIGGGVVRGASFLKYGLLGRKKDGDSAEETMSVAEEATTDGVVPPPAIVEEPAPPTSSSVNSSGLQHARSRSSVSQVTSLVPGKAESGVATIAIVSASGFPTSTHLRVHVRMVGPKGSKDVHKTKAIKDGGSGRVQYDANHETFRVHATADTRYQLRVVNHATFGSDTVLGDGVFFVDDQGSVSGQDKTVNVGEGVVVVRSSFAPSDQPRPSTSQRRPSTSRSVRGDGASELLESPDSHKTRRSILGRRNVSGA
ncbi:hypothetical protein MAP00_005580 [Monascus purpureus]|nr:hypothetical protein MAP00_005580 [Monascus purpureus]